MGGHISQKWFEVTTADHEIDRHGGVYRLVIENVDRYGCDYQLLTEIMHLSMLSRWGGGGERPGIGGGFDSSHRP